MKLRNHIMFICFSYYFHIIFTFWGPGPGPGPQSGGLISQFHKPGTGPDFTISHYFHICSYYFHIFITFWGSGPRSGPQKPYFCHIPGHFIFIFLRKPSFPACPYRQSLQWMPTWVSWLLLGCLLYSCGHKCIHANKVEW